MDLPMIKLLKTLFSFETVVFLLLIVLGYHSADLPVPRIVTGGGSGAFISNEGHFVTNRHVAVFSKYGKTFIKYSSSVKPMPEISIGAYTDYFFLHGLNRALQAKYIVMRPAELVRLSDDRDVAVLKVKQNTPCLKVTETDMLLPGTKFEALILNMFVGTDFFRTAKWVAVPDTVREILPDMQFPEQATVHYPNYAIAGTFARPGNSGSVIINPETKEIIGLVYGGVTSVFMGMYVPVASLLLQPVDITKTMTETGQNIVCTNPSVDKPLRTVGQVIIYVDEKNLEAAENG